jgi:hypothetical protein
MYRKRNEDHHHIPEMEFSAFFDKTTNVQGDRVIYLKYLLFIKYKDKIYIDVKNVGYIIMPFEELLKNKLLKMYYDLSLLLVKDKNRFVEKVSNEGERIWDAEITDIYNGKRNCFVDCAYIFNNEIRTDKHYCYYEINPYELMLMNRKHGFVNTVSEIEWFNHIFKVRLGYEVISFDKRRINYTNLAIAYNASLMEKELDEISAIEEDKQNLIKLVAFYDSKKNMNCDLFEVIYNNLIRATDTFAPYLENLEDSDNTVSTLILAT